METLGPAKYPLHLLGHPAGKGFGVSSGRLGILDLPRRWHPPMMNRPRGFGRSRLNSLDLGRHNRLKGPHAFGMRPLLQGLKQYRPKLVSVRHFPKKLP